MQNKKTLVCMILACLLTGFASTSMANQTVNLRISPVSLLVGAVNIEADLAVNRNVTIAPMYTRWTFNTASDFDADITGYGMRIDYHPSRVFREGVYYGGFYKRWDVNVEYLNAEETGMVNSEVSVDTLGALIGHRWMWRSFNINIEAGYRLMLFNDFDFTLEAGSTNRVNITDISAMGGAMADVGIAWAF